MSEHERLDNSRVIKAPTGTELSCGSWQTEAPLRMLMNNLDQDVAENHRSLWSMAALAAQRGIGPVMIVSFRA